MTGGNPMTVEERHRQNKKCLGCAYRKEIIEAELFLKRKYNEDYVDRLDDDEPSAR